MNDQVEARQQAKKKMRDDYEAFLKKQVEAAEARTANAVEVTTKAIADAEAKPVLQVDKVLEASKDGAYKTRTVEAVHHAPAPAPHKQEGSASPVGHLTPAEREARSLSKRDLQAKE